MRLFFTTEEFIYKGKPSVIRKSRAFETNEGFKLYGEGTCTCGLVFDEIYGKNSGLGSGLLPGMVSRD